jgi:hypothetical protein
MTVILYVAIISNKPTSRAFASLLQMPRFVRLLLIEISVETINCHLSDCRRVFRTRCAAAAAAAVTLGCRHFT